MGNATEEESRVRPEAGFFGSRTGWRELKERLLLEPIVGGSRWAAAFGSLLLFTFILQVVTGILLTTCYAPSVGTAWQSVKYIQEEAPLGWFIRGLHHWGSSLMVILLMFHMVQVYVWGAYKRPRQLTWMTGVLLLGLIMGLAFTGYLLPWDEKAYWASKVGLGILGTVPWAGPYLRTLFQGGPDLGNLTLTRFFAFHGFILPGAVVVLIVVHLYLFRLHGVTTAWWENEQLLKRKTEPFWPGQVWKDGVVILGLLLGLSAWVCTHPVPLAALADPSKPYEARPEWYFMFLFQILRYFHGKYEIVGTFVLPTLFFGIMLFWPFLDRNPVRDPRKRPIAMGLFAVSTFGLIGLTVYAVDTDVRMSKPETALQPKPSAPALQKLDVAGLYSDNCLACHGEAGTGDALRAAFPTLPDFTNAGWQKTQTDADFKIRIDQGKPPAMPPFKDKLNPEQIQALVAYTRAFAREPAHP